ncbi:hypothetical protein F2Q69_00043643 [Brassica cretica]|uniref:Uncharacterized protein n=1 Tax=Brassica cretica TaxID=69181 RepID=A0A8S9N748_BRACR|nr:hypothetical protein F2Q69_00043643 [Brassica cretica]
MLKGRNFKQVGPSRPVPSRTAAGSSSRRSRGIRSARTAVSKRSAQSRPAKMHSPLQAVPRAGRKGMHQDTS